MWMYLYVESDHFDEGESNSFFRMVYHFLKGRHSETIKIIDNVVFYISCYPMASTHV